MRAKVGVAVLVIDFMMIRYIDYKSCEGGIVYGYD